MNKSVNALNSVNRFEVKQITIKLDHFIARLEAKFAHNNIRVLLAYALPINKYLAPGSARRTIR